MKIILENISKRYNSDWIFKNVGYEFSAGNAYVVLGANGSGKSTLLQVIAGNQLASEGNITYINGEFVEKDQVFRQVSISAPYLDLMEEFTLTEAIRFHGRFKPFLKNLNEAAIVTLCDLSNAKNKALKYYSSGMKQRVKLALAIVSDTPVLLLDEPTSNLDKKGIAWYQQLINEFTSNRLVIVCSNMQEQEYFFCNHTLLIEEYKK